jgi:hypothetical protein
MSADRFVETIEYTGPCQDWKIATLEYDPIWNLAFLPLGADGDISTSLTTPHETLADFRREVSELPPFGCVFVSPAVLDRMVTAAGVSKRRSPLVNLVRRALKVDDREIFLMGLGLKLATIEGHSVLKAVKRSNVVERMFFDSGTALHECNVDSGPSGAEGATAKDAANAAIKPQRVGPE